MSAPAAEAGLVEALRAARQQLLDQPGVEWSAGDLADWIGRLLGEEERDPLLDSTVQALQDGLDGERLDRAGLVDELPALATVALAHLRPRVTAQVIGDIAELVGEAELRCPVHDADDCAPDANGCTVPQSVLAAVGHYIRSFAAVAAADSQEPE